MQRFSSLVVRDGTLTMDPATAAQLEVEWWRIHRQHQRESALSERDLVAALCDLHSCVYSTTREAVRAAAVHRVTAMRLSDDWVAAGCDPHSRLLDALVASYTALLDAVGDRDVGSR
jgi:hypothetical protein